MVLLLWNANLRKPGLYKLNKLIPNIMRLIQKVFKFASTSISEHGSTLPTSKELKDLHLIVNGNKSDIKLTDLFIDEYDYRPYAGGIKGWSLIQHISISEGTISLNNISYEIGFYSPSASVTKEFKLISIEDPVVIFNDKEMLAEKINKISNRILGFAKAPEKVPGEAEKEGNPLLQPHGAAPSPAGAVSGVELLESKQYDNDAKILEEQGYKKSRIPGTNYMILFKKDEEPYLSEILEGDDYRDIDFISQEGTIIKFDGVQVEIIEDGFQQVINK